jgi:hypothetical protein
MDPSMLAFVKYLNCVETTNENQLWYPIWDPDLGPRFRTPIWNPDLGPRFGTPIWDPNLGPQFGTPIWDPDL